MKKSLTLILFVLGVGIVIWFGFLRSEIPPHSAPTYVLEESPSTQDAGEEIIPLVSTVAENLEIPWEVLFLPNGDILVTERPGTVLLLKEGVEIAVPGVRHVGEGGLLGATLHPEFEINNLLYLYQTTETENGLINRIVRYHLQDGALEIDRVIFDNIPGARYHDGGRIAFGPDGHLYVAVGDAVDEDAAQNPQNLAGSILRITEEGEIPEDNPFGNAVYSYGHRNPQGLAWDESGQLWSTEHGRSGVASGYDELNRIEKGGNYGWPDSQGDEVLSGTIGPERHSGASTTWAPGSLTFLNGSLYFAGLRGETLYEAVLDDEGEVTAWYEHFVGEYGRLRTVTVGPDGMLYLTTSNRDGRTGDVAASDDRLFRINPAMLTR